MKIKLVHTCKADNFTNLNPAKGRVPIQTPCIAYGHMAAPALECAIDRQVFKKPKIMKEIGRIFPRGYKFISLTKQSF